MERKYRQTGFPVRTFLSSAEEKEFRLWYDQVSKHKNLNPNPDDQNQYYDYRGYWKYDDRNGILNEGSEAHFTDKYKTPGHPTFSNESIYSNDKNPGGSWSQDDKGTWYFNHSEYTGKHADRTFNYLDGTGEFSILQGDTLRDRNQIKRKYKGGGFVRNLPEATVTANSNIRFVTSADDPRYKAYQDSLNLYNKYIERYAPEMRRNLEAKKFQDEEYKGQDISDWTVQQIAKKDPAIYFKKGTKEYDETIKWTKKHWGRKEHPNIAPVAVWETGEYEFTGLREYKKPTQPIEVRPLPNQLPSRPAPTLNAPEGRNLIDIQTYNVDPWDKTFGNIPPHAIDEMKRGHRDKVKMHRTYDKNGNVVELWGSDYNDSIRENLIPYGHPDRKGFNSGQEFIQERQRKGMRPVMNRPRQYRSGGFVIPENKNQSTNHIDELDQYLEARRNYINKAESVNNTRDQLQNEEERVSLVRENISKTALRALYDDKFRYENFSNLIGPACTSSACMIDQLSGATIPSDVSVFGIPRKAGDKIPMIPGTTSWKNYAQKIGYESLPYNENDTIPGDRIMWNNGTQGHTIIKVDGEEDTVYSPGSPGQIESNYPVQKRLSLDMPRVYRYVGGVNNIKENLENQQREMPEMPTYEHRNIPGLPARVQVDKSNMQLKKRSYKN
jgi:hypothetical protein